MLPALLGSVNKRPKESARSDQKFLKVRRLGKILALRGGPANVFWFRLSAIVMVIVFGELATFAKSNSRATAVDAYLQPYVQSQNFSGVVLVEQGGKVIFEKAYGFADRDKRLRNIRSTRFHIASVSMQFTAAAVLR